MPVGSANTGKRFRRRRFRRTRRAASKAVKTYVRSALRRQLRFSVESKYHIQVYDNSINGNGVVSRLSAMAQGSSDILRVGDKINLGAFRANFRWTRNSTDTTAQRHCRLIIFQWCNNDALYTPQVTDIITNVTYGTLRMIDHDNLHAGLIVPLYDRLFTLDADDPSVDQSIVLKPRRRHVDFYQSGVNGTNHIYFLAISDAALDTPALQLMTKVNFTDA